MSPELSDLAVGTVTICLGIFLLGVAAVNWHWFYTLRSARLLQTCFGRLGARCVHAALGLALVALGVAITMGYRLPLFAS
jgi:small neutral amino acid transporter SnatA (MarC family)